MNGHKSQAHAQQADTVTKVEAKLAPSEPLATPMPNPNCPSCEGTGLEGDCGDDGQIVGVHCGCWSDGWTWHWHVGAIPPKEQA